MEHANELHAPHSHQCFAARRGEHRVDEVQIDACHKEGFPAIHTVGVWLRGWTLLVCTELGLVTTGFNRTIHDGDVLSA